MRALFALLVLLSAPTGLSELDTLKAENHRLKVQVLSLQEQLAAAQVKLQAIALTEEQTQLEQSFKATLKPADGLIWNWDHLAFEAGK